MKKIMTTQSIFWAAAILAPAINPEAGWWLVVLLAVMAIENLRREINKITT